jgi:hypothetical protein
MKILDFSIKKSEGKKFAVNSGDLNKIHLDFIEGYNSHFGQNIVHGCLVIIKFLNILKTKKIQTLKFEFNNAFFYDDLITLYKTKLNKYKFVQNNKIKSIAKLNFKTSNYNPFDNKKKLFSKIFKIKKFDYELKSCLSSLSKYVGMYYPGEYSLITKILIKQKTFNNTKQNKIHIYSTKPDKRFPLIENTLNSRNYNISFQTSFRPKLKIDLKRLSGKFKKYLKQINKNILIIGASNGIGYDLLNIVKQNKRIKILATYNKNKITLKQKNILKFKIDIEKDIKKLKKIIKTYAPLSIYYFATPKINSNDKIQKTQLYKKYYLTTPLELINFSKFSNNNFFYPSTILIGKNNSPYAITKFQAEKKLKKVDPNIQIIRIPEVNTKQNLSLIKRKLPNFSDLLLKDQNLFKKVFFIN